MCHWRIFVIFFVLLTDKSWQRQEKWKSESRHSPHEPLIGPQESDVAEEFGANWLDVRGGWLDPAVVRKARQDEVTEFHSCGFIDIVPRQQFEEHQQREAAADREIKPIDTRRPNMNESNEAEPEMRSMVSMVVISSGYRSSA